MRKHGRNRWISVLFSLLSVWDFSVAQLVMMDFADSSNINNVTVPPPLPVITETCGDAFNKFAMIPASAKEEHEVGRLVDFDGGPGWGPFMIISGNDKSVFKIDKEGTIRVAFPFFDLDEYRIRLASLNGNLICTVQINIRIGNTTFTSIPAVTNQTFEDNMILGPDHHGTTTLLWSQMTTVSTPPSTVELIPATTPVTVGTTTRSTNAPTTSSPFTTIVLTNATSVPLANIIGSDNNSELFGDRDVESPFDLDKVNVSKKQGTIIGTPGGGTFPLGPRCIDSLLTVAVPTDTPVNTPITKVTATYQANTPIIYSINDVVFDRFRVDSFTGQVFTGPQSLIGGGRSLTVRRRVSRQTRSALEFRVRATVPNGQHCETTIRVNVIPTPNSILFPPVITQPQVTFGQGRSPPFFAAPVLSLAARSCQAGDIIGRVDARDIDVGDRVTYVIDNPSNEVSIDPSNGLLRVGSALNFQQRLIRPIVRAIDTTGLSSTATVNIELLCEIAPLQIAPGPLRFSQQTYRFPVFNCNAGTIAGTVTLLGMAVSPVRFELSNPFEFTLETNGPNALIRLAAFMASGNPQRTQISATDNVGTRAQAGIVLDMVCGPVDPSSAFRPQQGPSLQLDQNLLGFNPMTGPAFFAPNQNGPLLGAPPRNLGPQTGFIPDEVPLGPPPRLGGFSNGFPPENFPLGANEIPPVQTQFGGLPPGFFSPPVSFQDAMLQQRFPQRFLDTNPSLDTAPPNNVQAFVSGEINFVPNIRPTSGLRPLRPHLLGDPNREDGTFVLTLNSNENSNDNNFSFNNNEENRQQPGTFQNDQTLEDPNQRAINPNPQRQLTVPTGPFGFNGLTGPQFNGPNQFAGNQGQVPFQNSFPQIGGPGAGGSPFPFSSIQGPQFQQTPNFPLTPQNFPGGGIFPGQHQIGIVDAGRPEFRLPSGIMMGLGDPLGSRQLFPGFPELTIQLPQTAGQTPPIFVTPLCAPPNTNFVGRIRAIDHDPNDRITYFIYSTGGTDVFEVHSSTGDVRSRTALTVGVFHVDVGARDSSGRTAVMRLEISINPACLQPRSMTIDFPLPNTNLIPGAFPSQFDARQLALFNQPVAQPVAVQPNRQLTTSKALPCSEDSVPVMPNERSSLAALNPTVNHFGSGRPLSKPGGLTVKGPAVVAVDAPFDGSLPVTLPTGTILAEYFVTGGSGTYRWVDSDISRFEMTGEATGTLKTTSPLAIGSYEYRSLVKDNIGNVAALKVRIIVRSPDLVDNGLLTGKDLPISTLRSHRDRTN